MLRFEAQIGVSTFRQAVLSGAQPVLLAFLADVRTEIRRRMDAPKSGKPGPKRQRSAPGEAPARQGGRLYEEIEILPIPLAPELLITAPYADILENYMDRPFAQVSVDDVRERFSALAFAA